MGSLPSVHETGRFDPMTSLHEVRFMNQIFAWFQVHLAHFTVNLPAS